MSVTRRRTVIIASSAAALAGIAGGALGFTMHAVDHTAHAPVPSIAVTTPAHPIAPVAVTTPAAPITRVVVVPVTPVTPITPATPVKPITPVTPVHPVIPQYAGTIRMTITNNTDETLNLAGSDNPYGDWIVTPRAALAPGASETVSASTWNQGGFGVDVTYDGADGASTVFMANNYSGQTDTDGTRVDGSNPGHWVIQNSVNQGAPNMTASYTVMPGLLTPPPAPVPVIPDEQPVTPVISPVTPDEQPVISPVTPDSTDSVTAASVGSGSAASGLVS